VSPPGNDLQDQERAAAPDPKVVRGAREALWATAGLLALLWGGKHLAAVMPWGDVIFTAIAAFQLYVPLWLIQRRGEAPESHAIHIHGLLLGPVAALRWWLVRARRARAVAARARGVVSRRLRSTIALYGRGAYLRGADLLRDVGRALLVAALVFPVFALLHHGWQTIVMGHAGYTFRVPPDLLAILLKNVFLIAIPEELFYRGFVETRLSRLWPVTRFVLGIPIGRAVILASALFALGHFLGEYNPARLGPFFPAFVFSALTRRSGSITGAVLFHGLSNAFSAFLFAGYFR
jgi:uncharacterized protein